MADQPQTAPPTAPANPGVPQDRAASNYDKQGRLTLSGMRVKHAAGYSVIHNGVIIAPGQPLPSEADLAAATGDTAELDRVRQQNEAEIERLRAENQRLKDQAKAVAQQPPHAAPPAPATAPVAPARK